MFNCKKNPQEQIKVLTSDRILSFGLHFKKLYPTDVNYEKLDKALGTEQFLTSQAQSLQCQWIMRYLRLYQLLYGILICNLPPFIALRRQVKEVKQTCSFHKLTGPCSQN